MLLNKNGAFVISSCLVCVGELCSLSKQYLTRHACDNLQCTQRSVWQRDFRLIMNRYKTNLFEHHLARRLSETCRSMIDRILNTAQRLTDMLDTVATTLKRDRCPRRRRRSHVTRNVVRRSLIRHSTTLSMYDSGVSMLYHCFASGRWRGYCDRKSSSQACCTVRRPGQQRRSCVDV